MTAFLAALAAFFLFGTYGFYLLLALAFIIATAFEENKHEFFALATLIIALACGQILKPVGLAIVAHPGYAALAAFGYFVLGTGWGVAKWVLFVRNNVEKFNEFKTDWVARREARIKQMGVVRGTVNESDELFQHELNNHGIEHNPKIRDHKEDFLRWATFWPLSFVWTAISDPITKVFRHIYYSLQSTLQAISDRMFANSPLDLPPIPVVETADTVNAKFAAAGGASHSRRFGGDVD